MIGFVFGALTLTEINQDQRLIRQSGLFSQHSGSVVTALGEERIILVATNMAMKTAPATHPPMPPAIRLSAISMKPTTSVATARNPRTTRSHAVKMDLKLSPIGTPCQPLYDSSKMKCDPVGISGM